MEHSKLIDAYLAGIELLTTAVSGLNAEQVRARPVAGTWSILEIVCHLADSEALFVDRMKRVLAENGPPLLFADPGAFVAALACHDRDLSEEVALTGLLRKQMARILRVQPAEAWQRVGVHNRDGEKTLEQLLTKSTQHLEHHLGFIQEKRSRVEQV